METIELSEFRKTKVVEANIDGKNIVPDFIFEDLFNDGLYVEKDNKAVGFVGKLPTLCKYIGNCMTIVVSESSWMDELGEWRNIVLERLTGYPVSFPEWVEHKPVCFKGDEGNPDSIYYIEMGVGFVSVHFYLKD